MSRMFYHVMQDNLGNLLFDVTGTMRVEGTGTLATIYGDAALTVPIPNPMTNHPSFGSFKCFLGAGNYDFYMAKPGYAFETLTGVQGHGTMALQNASSVAITGGTVLGLTTLQVLGTNNFNTTSNGYGAPNFTPASGDAYAYHGNVLTGANRWNCYMLGTAPNYFAGPLTLGLPNPQANVRLFVWYNQGSHAGMVFQPSDNDSGSFAAQLFQNTAGVQVGSIKTTVAATAYNTTSDARLKDEVQPLTGALDVVRALNPVSFLWKADGTPSRGLLAHEVAEVVDGVITGERDAVDEDGNILAQQIDYSKLVPHLVAAVKELTQQVEMLTAKLASR